MFYTIHRCIKALCYGVALLVAFKLYENRAVFEPALIWYNVWDNGGMHVPEPKSMSGRVAYVIGSQTFVLATRSGDRFNVRLMGLRPPSDDRSIEALAHEKGRKDALKKMIEGQWVHLEISYENLNNLGGVAFLGSTNVNAELVRLGVARSRMETAKGLPGDSQYALIWASRHRMALK